VPVTLQASEEKLSVDDDALSTDIESFIFDSRGEFTESTETPIQTLISVDSTQTTDSTRVFDIGDISLGIAFSEVSTSLSEAVTEGTVYVVGATVVIATQDDVFFVTSSSAGGDGGSEVSISKSESTANVTRFKSNASVTSSESNASVESSDASVEITDSNNK
jgi:hypothetical protein